MAFSETLAQIALTEFAFWTDGNHRECLKELPEDVPHKHVGEKRVAKYWKEGLGLNGLDGCSKQAWSAAFICWCMKQAEMPLIEFPYSTGHHTYIRWSINNTKRSKLGKSYYGRRLTEFRPRPGDLIAQWRRPKVNAPDPNISFDLQPDDFYPSHCDIVVEASATQIVTVGGNLSNRVKKTIFPAQNGILTPKNELICVMECRKQ